VRDFHSIQQYLTKDGYDGLQRIFGNKRTLIGHDAVKVYLVKKAPFIEVRQIPIILEPKNAAVDTPRTEYVFMGFRANGIPQLAYISYDGFSLHNSIVRFERSLNNDRSSVVASIDKFMRDLEQAYNKRNMTYLRQVYFDTTKIIVGKDLGFGRLNRQKTFRDDILIQREPKAYLDSLETIFKNSKKLIVRFDTLDIRKIPKLKDSYAVEAYQIWEDDTYEDEGWVGFYLTTDREMKRIIETRAWLPEKQWTRQP
jgi:hypothetical protein